MTPPDPAPIRQPYLHELVTCVRAPTAVLSGPDGQIRSGGVQGWFGHDRRALSELVVDVDGQEPIPVGHHQLDAGTADFVGIVRHLGDPSADPTVRLERSRTAGADGFKERLRLVNASRRTVPATVRMRVAVDLAAMDAVKHGEATATTLPATTSTDGATWLDGRTRVSLRAAGGARVGTTADRRVEISWQVTVPAHRSWEVALSVRATSLGAGGTTFASVAAPASPPPTLSGPPDLVGLLRQGVADLTALTLGDPLAPEDTFIAAGSPWFLTLFGRDSLWAARLALPLGTDLARGTLRALARRQGRRHDPDTAEAPGKIPHEVRCQPQRAIGGKLVYFGTVDATALWVCLLHDAWRWGMPADDVAALLDPLQAALGWLVDEADPDGDGFLEYLDHTGTGLANQGWKDSGDSIQFPDGTIAEPPIALSEAQAYAFQAASCGADLLDTFGRPGADRIRAWAAALRERFREAFWVSDRRGRFPAIALEGAKRPVDVAASNLGHLLGTGLLTAAEAASVTARLTEPDLDCGYGLRTMSSGATGFNPLGYHVGTVWPHDTAIAVQGLVREGQPGAAESLAGGLLRAAPGFQHRLPELFGGTDARVGQLPLAYPAACRPQAWSAAVGVALLRAALGLEPDVPGGVLTVRPQFPSWLPLRVTGLRLAGHPLSVSVDIDGKVEVETSAPIRQRPPAPDRVALPRQLPAHAPAGDQGREPSPATGSE
jgi:glycogen debranching enzyme